MLLSYIFDVFLIILLFGAFGYIHSWTASNKIKRLVIRHLSNKIAFYRLAYNVLSTVLLYIVFKLMPKPDINIYDLPYPYDFIVLIPQVLALAGLFWTSRYFSLSEFLGIEQIIKWKKGEYNPADLDEKLTLKIEGPYRFVRHPLYLFSIVFLLFRATMDLFYITLLICIIIYFYFGSVYEEKKLVEKFGEDYLKYQASVPQLLPLHLFHPYKFEVK